MLVLQALTVGVALAATLMLVAAEAAPVVGGKAPTTAGASARATDYELEPAGSSLRFTAVQQGATFESRFETFTARVSFDPAKPETGRISARIDLASVDTGNPERDETLKTADWFHVTQWPQAVFTARRILRAGPGYAARGTLTLRGVSRPVTLRFRWSPAAPGQPARLVGSATLDRLAFGVGQGDWQDTTYVGSAVDVRVDIRLRAAHGTDKSLSIKGSAPNAG